MKCTYFNAFTGVPVYSRARKIEIKWAKTASPPIRVASQYESINVSPPFGLSVNRLSPPFIRRPRMACFETVDFRKGTLQVFRDTRVSIHHRETRTLLRASISSRSENDRARYDSMFLFRIEYFKWWFEMGACSSAWDGSCFFEGVMITWIFVIIETRKYSRLYVCV